MITRIELTNFMSHAHTVIEPAAGLTVLVGANNIGKSAVIAALQILARNETSTYVMRHGAKECSVKVETDDGQVVEWRRKKSPSYVINGQTFDRLRGGDLPEELHRALRLPPVDAGGDDDFDVHFGTQKSPIFLLDRPGTVAARFFASSSDAIRLVEIQKRHKDKHAEAKREKGRLEEEARRVTAQLDVLAPVVDLDDRLRAVEDLHAEVIQLREQLDEARADAADLAAQTERLAQWQTRADVLTRLPSPPDLFPVVPLDRLAANLVRQAADVERNDAVHHTLTPLTGPPTLEPTEPLRQTVAHLERAANQQVAAMARHETLTQLASPPDLGNETELRHRLIALTKAQRQTELWAAQVELLHAVVEPPLPEETVPLATTLSQLDAAEREEQRGQDRLADAADELAQVARELRELAAGSQCRLCGSPLDPDRVLAHAAAGLGGHAHE